MNSQKEITQEKLIQINENILKAKSLLEQLNNDATEFPSLARNSERALTSIKMLELNISDLISFDLIS